MQQHIGECIRQNRRQQNLTQTSLGGDLYSKSYVSAIERGKIIPSREALSHFAEQLGYPNDYFLSLFQDIHSANESAPGAGEKNVEGTNGTVLQNKTLTMLDMLLENADPAELLAHYELPVLSAEVLAALPAKKQAGYYYMLGLAAQEQRNYAAALQFFESALGLASLELKIALLDHLGLNYFLTHRFQTALHYHIRALDLLEKATQDGYSMSNDQHFMIELHCGDDYRAVGAYKQACTHYELARTLIQPQHDMRTAAFLYQELGYCLYAEIYRFTSLSLPEEQQVSLEKMEFELQRAIGFLVQSRTLYQVGGDKVGECKARLTQALVLLDLNNRRKQYGLKLRKQDGITPSLYGSSLLNEAEEQCLQVLMNSQKLLKEPSFAQLHEQDGAIYASLVYLALVYLVRVHTGRASLARLNNYHDTSLAERNAAVQLCEHVLNALPVQTPPQSLILEVLSPGPQNTTQLYSSVEQLRLPELNGTSHRPTTLIELYFATSEVAEELGFAATNEEYSHYCYDHATHTMREALALARSQKLDSDLEPNYTLRCYQRSICLLEERNLVSPEYAGETNKVLLHVLEEAFHDLQSPVLQLS